MRKETVMFMIGVIGIVLGVGILIFTLTLINIIAGCDMQSLVFGYGPKAPPEARTYERLYDLTKHIGNQRNFLLKLFFYTISFASMAFGTIFLMWARDKKRQLKLIQDLPE